MRHNLSQSHSSQYSSSSSTRRNKLPLEVRTQLIANSTESQQKNNSYGLNIVNIVSHAMRKQSCRLCENNFHQTQLTTLCQCQHRFCVNCLTQYVIYKIDVGQQIFCPSQDCQNTINQKGQIFMSLSNIHAQRYMKQCLWRQTMRNPNTKICPYQQCKQGVVDLLLQPPECRVCGTKFCSECMMKAHTGPCDKNFQGKFREWKRCPKCRLFINKDGGCNHIICQCRQQFCFVCLSEWDDDHYQCVDIQQLRGPLRDCMSKVPIISMLILIVFFPLFLVALIGLGCLFIVISSIGGMIGVPIFLVKEKNCPCVLVILLLPFLVIIGGIAMLFYVLFVIYRPLSIRLVSLYCRIIESLWYDAFEH